ncbi:NAD-dependent epimerase/dehydratase family protein [Candidatus Omnitrophota bacterium]
MKKVLVTGGCGFIGSWCCEYYARKGWKAVSFDNMTKQELARTGYNTEASRDYNWNYLQSLGVEMVKADVRDKEAVFERAKDADFIIHTAAQPAVTISIEDPGLDFSTNVQGTLNILEAAKAFNVPLVSCATIHVYGNLINDELKEAKTRYTRDPEGIDESYPILTGVLTPLHASKAAADSYVRVYSDTYKVKAASFRLTGLYGERQLGGEDHGWVANFSIRAILGLPLRIYGTGRQVRDILYAADLVEAFDAFYHDPVPGVYNIGGGGTTAISLIECIEIISKILGTKLNVEFHPARHGDLSYFVCDARKAKKFLKWQAKTHPETGVTNLIKWIKGNLELFKK